MGENWTEQQSPITMPLAGMCFAPGTFTLWILPLTLMKPEVQHLVWLAKPDLYLIFLLTTFICLYVYLYVYVTLILENVLSICCACALYISLREVGNVLSIPCMSVKN